MSVRLAALAVVAVVLAVAAPGPASASWSRARLMTTNGLEQALLPDLSANPVMAPAISADGRYVAFWTPARNLFSFAGPDAQLATKSAVLRRDVDGGRLDLVAVTETPSPGAATPSAVAMSADGRFVAFVTARVLDGSAGAAVCDADTQDCDATADVYVRDMSVPADRPEAFELASPGADPGSWDLPGARALSSDGRTVLLRRDRTLAVRDRAARATTTLTTSLSASGRRATALSGDGSTAVWVDDDPRAATEPGQYLDGESPLASANLGGESDALNVADLLWRRVTGPAARRVAAAGDGEDPACPAGSRLAPDEFAIVGVRGPCDGIFRQFPEARSFSGAALSFEGRTVAFVTDARRRSGLGGTDVFVRDMAAPGGRKASTTEITGFIGSGADPAVDLSADGSVLVLAAGNDRSALASPSFVSSALGEGPVNLYAADLQSRAVERVTAAYTGAPADAGRGVAGGSVNPVLTADGRRVAFYSTSTNLLFGDSNDAGDVFVADRFDDRQPPLPALGADALPSEEVTRASEVFPVWRLSTSVSRGGSVLYVDALVPGPGTVTATARASRKVRGRSRQSVIRRGRAGARSASRVRVRLRLPVKYRAAARRSRGLPVRVTVQFRSTGGATLTKRLDSVYRDTPERKKTRGRGR
jgi:Tol biopolymer transport system component